MVNVVELVGQVQQNVVLVQYVPMEMIIIHNVFQYLHHRHLL